MTNPNEKEWWKRTILDIEALLYEFSEITPSGHFVLDKDDFIKELKSYAKQQTVGKNQTTVESLP